MMIIRLLKSPNHPIMELKELEFNIRITESSKIEEKDFYYCTICMYVKYVC